MSETKTLRDAVGKALYLEFRREGYTFQAIVTPTVIDLKGVVVPSAFLRRKVSAITPRRSWNIDPSLANRNPLDVGLARDPMTGEFQQHAEWQNALNYHMSNSLAMSLRQAVSQGWKLHKNPIVVEIAYEDLEAIKSYKTPNALIRRINRSRVALGWGESLFNSVV